ncbi:MAG: hypothetical protein IJM85_02515 [Clostridia bacterium]|nr:hypothetical protein [Clostridia bacterium]
MIDIHSHILPGIDDGSDSMETSLEMLVTAARSGVKTIVATPHCNIPDEFGNYASEKLDMLFDQLESEAENAGIPIRIVKGMEIFATDDLPQLLRDGRVWTLNGTNYFLTEFDFEEEPDYCSEILRRCASMGFCPIIAHPERYRCIQEDPQLAFNWCISGYGLQLNKASLLGKFGPETQEIAELLVDHGLAACVASDAHGVIRRTTFMGGIKEYLTDNFGEQYAMLLLSENPSRILEGKRLLGLEPIPIY